jgi:5-methylthioadenosine/S-adenosylhomocysteine deaminase
VPRLRAAGIPVSLGTDGAASNDSHDMFQVIKMTALLQKLESLDPSVLNARDAITMATIEGARALNIADRVGSLEPGKLADVVHVAGASARMAYVHDPYQQLAYCAAPSDIANVWVGGRRIVDSGRLRTVDEGEVVARARTLARDLYARAGLEDVLRRDRGDRPQLVHR